MLVSLLFMSFRFGGSENLIFFSDTPSKKKKRLRQAPVTMLDGGAFDGAKAPTLGCNVETEVNHETVP